MSKTCGIYVHIPFCEKKCAYCAFSSFVASKDLQKRYFDALLKEIKSCNKTKVKTIYFGGGTPSAIPTSFIKKVLDKIKEKFDVDETAEITIECNPNSTDLRKLKAYRKMGFNRISFGVQSLDDKKLKSLGRLHTKQQACDVVKEAKLCGFENISVDFLIGIPNQTKKDITENVNFVKENDIPHVSAYMLQVEQGTSLFDWVKNGKVKVLEDDECVELYEFFVEELEKIGLKRYEISNFSKMGFESKHNRSYWERKNYLGFGLSAHSFVDGVRSANADNFDDYFKGKKAFQEKLLREEIVEEILMLGLRSNVGVKFKDLLDYGKHIEKDGEFLTLVSKGVLVVKNKKFFLSPKFYGVSNDVICRLISKI